MLSTSTTATVFDHLLSPYAQAFCTAISVRCLYVHAPLYQVGCSEKNVFVMPSPSRTCSCMPLHMPHCPVGEALGTLICYPMLGLCLGAARVEVAEGVTGMSLDVFVVSVGSEQSAVTGACPRRGAIALRGRGAAWRR